MKKLKFKLVLEFDGDIETNDEIMEVMENVSRAIVHHVHNIGIVPNSSDAVTKKVKLVYGNWINEKNIE